MKKVACHISKQRMLGHQATSHYSPQLHPEDSEWKKKNKTRTLMIPCVPFPKTPSLSHNIIWRVEGQGTRPLTNRLGGDELPWAL